MQVEWRKIDDFPNYTVSNTGYVRSEDYDRVLSKLMNQHGVVHVGLTRDRKLYKRSLARLVAEAFIEQPRDTFDTPINLDGDRSNNSVANLLWRPRWFATKYFQQFQQTHASIGVPVEMVGTDEVYENSFSAATALGVLDREIAISVMTQNYVWPINQKFRRLV